MAYMDGVWRRQRLCRIDSTTEERAADLSTSLLGLLHFLEFGMEGTDRNVVGLPTYAGIDINATTTTHQCHLTSRFGRLHVMRQCLNFANPKSTRVESHTNVKRSLHFIIITRARLIITQSARSIFTLHAEAQARDLSLSLLGIQDTKFTSQCEYSQTTRLHASTMGTGNLDRQHVPLFSNHARVV